MKKIILAITVAAILAGTYYAGVALRDHVSDAHQAHVEQLRQLSE